MTRARATDDASDRSAAARWATVAFTASSVSALVYFATSEGMHNFVGFLGDGVVRFARLFGLSA